MNYNEIMVAQAKSKVLRELGIDKETTKKVILPETVGTAYDSNPGVHFFSPISLREGEKYVVVFNGVVHNCTCVKFIAPDGGEQLILGNTMNPNTGEPFVVSTPNGADHTAVVPVDPSAGSPVILDTVTLEIYQETTTTTPINKDLLPGVCLPVVELSETFTGADEGVALTAEESALLTQCMSNNIPIVARLNVQDVGKFVYVCNILMGVYCGYDSLFNVTLMNQDGTWFANVTLEG